MTTRSQFRHLPPFHPDPGGAAPLHAQVRHYLRELIQRGPYRDGALLPDELTLVARLGVSRGTVRAGVAQLVHEGLLERKAGVGTRVRPPPAESGIGAWRSFSREMARKGIRVENLRQNYELVPAEEAAARALQIKPGAKIWRLDRVRGWQGRPVLHSRSWFHPRLRLAGNEDFSKPLYEVIESAAGVAAETAREEFTAVVAGAVMHRLLAMKSREPLLLRSHTVFDTGGRPVEFAEIHYVSSRFALTLDIRRDEK